MRDVSQLFVRFAHRKVELRSLGERHVVHRVPIVRKGIIEIECKRPGAALQTVKSCLRLPQLIIGEARGGDSHAAPALESCNFEDLPFGLGLHAGRQILADAFAIKPTGNAENDLPGGIREF